MLCHQNDSRDIGLQSSYLQRVAQLLKLDTHKTLDPSSFCWNPLCVYRESDGVRV